MLLYRILISDYLCVFVLFPVFDSGRYGISRDISHDTVPKRSLFSPLTLQVLSWLDWSRPVSNFSYKY